MSAVVAIRRAASNEAAAAAAGGAASICGARARRGRRLVVARVGREGEAEMALRRAGREEMAREGESEGMKA